MDYTTILAGLSDTKELWASVDMLRYLLLIVSMDTITGLYIAGIVERCEVFVLPRSGYSSWYHRAMLQCSGVLLITIMIVTGVTCIVSSDSMTSVLLAAAVLALNMLVVANIQIFVTLLCENITLGYMLSMMIELLSIFGSERLSPRGKMFLIGNWGMIIRTTVVNPNGISISAAIVLEVVILITLWELGWRVIRKHRKGA